MTEVLGLKQIIIFWIMLIIITTLHVQTDASIINLVMLDNIITSTMQMTVILALVFKAVFCQYTPKSDTVYILFNEVVTWETAADRCSNLKNGQLATFNTMNEYELIVDAVRDIQRRNPLHGAAWIGMTDFAEEGVWTFIDGDNSFCDEFGGCINAPFWMEGEPNNLGDEHCAVVTTETGRDVYDQKNVNDLRCEAEVEGYICEITNPSQIYYA